MATPLTKDVSGSIAESQIETVEGETLARSPFVELTASNAALTECLDTVSQTQTNTIVNRSPSTSVLAQSSQLEDPSTASPHSPVSSSLTISYSTAPPPALQPSLPGTTPFHPKAPSTLLFTRFTNLPPSQKALADAVCAKAQAHMAQYDNSHNWEHIQHVVANADLIYATELERGTEWVKKCDPLVLLLGAVLHDVADHKYESEEKQSNGGEEPKDLILEYLLTSSIPLPLATKINIIAGSVSYSTSIRDPALNRAHLMEFPELGIIQDADRIETLGARGQGRCFAYHGANRVFQRDSIQRAVQHHWEKLCLLPGVMNTVTGREMGEDAWRWMCEFRARWDWETSRLERVLT